MRQASFSKTHCKAVPATQGPPIHPAHGYPLDTIQHLLQQAVHSTHLQVLPTYLHSHAHLNYITPPSLHTCASACPKAVSTTLPFPMPIIGSLCVQRQPMSSPYAPTCLPFCPPARMPTCTSHTGYPCPRYATRHEPTSRCHNRTAMGWREGGKTQQDDQAVGTRGCLRRCLRGLQGHTRFHSRLLDGAAATTPAMIGQLLDRQPRIPLCAESDLYMCTQTSI